MAKRCLTVAELKRKLHERGARTTGKKQELLERLEAYERNDNFQGPAFQLSAEKEINWPSSNFHQLVPDHYASIPNITQGHITSYFLKNASSSSSSLKVKAIEKGKLLVSSSKVYALSITDSEDTTSEHMFISSIVGAAMKKKLRYNVKARLSKNGMVTGGHCECPAGRGPDSACKHLAATLLVLHEFKESKLIHTSGGITDRLQTFHRPARIHTGGPVTVEKLCIPDEDRLNEILADPREDRDINWPGYNDHVRNTTINYTNVEDKDINFRYLFGKADMASAMLDHDYLSMPFCEYWVDRALKVDEHSIKKIERATKNQAESKTWHEERKWRLTSSVFGTICHATGRRDKIRLCQTIINPPNLRSDAIYHGLSHEPLAIKAFEKQTGLIVSRSGLFVSKEYPFLAATPDGLVGENALVEVKCPYKGRNEVPMPGSCFSFLDHDSNGSVVLKPWSNYYHQIQGQLNIADRSICYFVVYTLKGLLVINILRDQTFWKASMLPKLQLFYTSHLRKYIAGKF